MDLGLKGKAAAVMAGSEGIGRACAFALAREGADVAICGRREDVLRSTAKEIADATGRRVTPIVADVTVAQDVERFVNAAASDLRGLHVLVVNAGGPAPGGFEALTDAQWHATFDLTVMSAVRAIRAALPHFRTERGGSVVGIGSTSVKQPIENLVLSNALRMSVMGLFKSLSIDHAPYNVRYNMVLPGGIATERLAELVRSQAEKAGIPEDEQWARRAKSTPLARMGEPEEIADAVAWLASERAKYVTGVALQVDGGLVRFPF
ncbi:MAG TPA: SDR family oxidoreductase [Candidatus Thermoplasmatota archaeon]|nr:SDR family oxidoreductase [Candidatus Thermoplasmatota archaeon]